MAAFSQWYDNFFSGIRKFSKNSTYSIENIEIDNKKISICLLNSAVFSLDDRDVGNLFIGRRNVEAAAKEINALDSDIKLAVMHHPFGWLSSIESIQVKSIINDNFDCILSGHLHENEIEKVIGSSGDALHLAAGATYQTRKWPNTALICEILDNNLCVTPIHYADSPRPVWTLDTTLFANSEKYQGIYSIDDTKKSNEGGIKKCDSKISSNDAKKDSPEINFLKSQLEEHLFTTYDGRFVYAHPHLMSHPQGSNTHSTDLQPVAISDIVGTTESIYIEGRPEYGGSTICRVLQLELVRSGKKATIKNARDLPNYKRKLEIEFQTII